MGERRVFEGISLPQPSNPGSMHLRQPDGGGYGVLALEAPLREFRGKRVRITVEVIEPDNAQPTAGRAPGKEDSNG